MGRKTKQNKITSPELLAQVNKENLRIIDDFLAYLRSVQRSEETIAGYKSDLRIFFVWALNNADNKTFCNINKRDIARFQAYMDGENENSPSRIRRLKSAISSLSLYVENMCEDIYPGFKNIVRKVENPANAPVRKKTIFDEAQIETLLNHFSAAGQHQKACAVALAIFSGSRKGELPRYKVDYFSDDNIVFGSLYKTPETIKTKGRGKNGKQLNRYVLASSFKPYFDAWMQQRADLGIQSEWLLVAQNDDGSYGQLGINTLNSWAETCSNVLGIDYYWHAGRHMFVSRLLRLGLPDSVVQTIMGWQNSEMIRVYDDRPQDETLGQYFKDGEVVAKSAKLTDL